MNRSRRGIMLSLLGVSAASFLPAAADKAPSRPDHFPFGPLGTPRLIPPFDVVKQDASAANLAAMLGGHVSAVQLMFTSCNATCPIQGAIFAEAQQQLGQSIPGAQFISLSIDPKNDTPAAMTEWLKKFKARPGWFGLTPRSRDLEAIFNVLGDGGLPRPQGADPHTGQVYLISRAGKLVFRTSSMPAPKQIVDAMAAVAGLK